MPTLTVGMACYADYAGVWATVQALRMYHKDAMRGAELVIVDNAPQHPDGQSVRNLMGWMRGDVRAAKYVPMQSPVGTAAPRERVAKEATSDVVVVMDCHVLLEQGGLDALLKYFADRPNSKDLAGGPMLYDDLQGRSAKFLDTWRSEMRGVWDDDRRADTASPEYTGDPFEVLGQGLGLYAFWRTNWVGFNPDFTHFGGEEMYLHEKVRRAGGRVVCVPQALWPHRFGKPGGRTLYPLSRFHKVRNYVIGHRELNMPLDRVHQHFVSLTHPGESLDAHLLREHSTDAREKTQAEKEALHRACKLSEEHWDLILAGAKDPPKKEECKGCAAGVEGIQDKTMDMEPATLEQWYGWAAERKSHLNEHVPKLRELASQAERTLELGGERSQSTVALRAGCPHVTVVDPKVWREDGWLEKDGVKFVRARSEAAEVEGEYNLLFIDTVHSAEQVYKELVKYAPRIKGRVCLHDTATYGERGQDGKAGLLPAVRRYLREHMEWSTLYHTQAQYGLTVISNLESDKRSLPSTARLAINFSRAWLKRIAAGEVGKYVSEDTADARFDQCLMCDLRVRNRCTHPSCGCYLDEKPDGSPGKVTWATEECPIGRWHPAEAAR